MTLQPSMLSAILSMDAYNRGYNAAIDGLSNTQGAKLGFATISVNSSDALQDSDQTIGFYAIAYDIDDNGDGIADRKIIAYRGTDFPEDGPLLPLDIVHGWTLGAGNLDSEQAAMAVAFYKEVVGTGNQYTANVSLTGHSLGGGLASFIGALYDQDVYSFDTMTFQAAVEKVERIMTTNAAYLDTHYTVRWEALNPRFSLWYESSQSGLTYEQAQQKIAELAALHYVRNVTMETMMPAIVDDIYDGITFKAPDFAGMYGFYVNGELLDVALTARGDEHQYIALTSMDGVDIISDRTIVPGWFIINEVYNTSKEALARHSMTALIIDKYSWSSSLISDSSIQQIKHYMWPLLFNSGFAENIGMDHTDLDGELQRQEDYAGILRMILAYSAVDEGENSTAARPFGDTAIKAMMADFNDLGSILEYIEHSPGLDIDNSAIKILASDISQYIINYAGQLALNKVLESDSPNAIVGVLNNHNGISTVNLSPAIWGQRIGEADNKVNIFKEDIVANALNIYDNAARILSVATSIWGQDAKTAIDYIDIDYALGSSHYNSRMYEFRHEVQTSHLLYLGVQADLDNLPYNNAVQYYHSANAANAILIGSNGHDRLKGNYGSDIFYGGAGDDWFDGGFDLYIPSVDIVVYDGNYSEYKITYKDTHVEVRALNSDEGTDYLYGIEQLSFNNRLYDLSFSYWSRYGSEFNELDDISNAWHSGAVNLPKRGYETYDGSKWVVYPYIPVNGTDGGDIMSSQWGNYFLNGGNGNDVISSHLYGSSISGGAGNDYLRAGNDGILVSGGDGNDILAASGYYNKLVGGLGDDVYQLGSWVNSVNNGLYEVGLIEEEEDGGHDTITTYYPIELWMASDGYLYIRYADFYDHEPQPYKINTFSGVPSVEVLINEDDRSITDLRMGLNMKTWGDFDSGHYVQGTAYNDVITTGFGNQYIHAGAGDDIIYANTQQQDYTSQIMYGENGNDLFYLDGGWSEHHWYVDGGAGDDVFHGIGGYMNTIQGGTGYDIGYIGGNYNSYDVINRGSYIEYFGTRLYSIEKLYFDNGYYSSGTFTPYASGNQNPIVKNDNFNVFKNTKLSGNLLADNGHGIDYDPDGDVITVGVAHYEATTMQGGKIYLSGDGSFMYEPPVNYTGTDQYWYSVKDEHGLSSGGSMHFNILPSSNSTPIAQNDLFYLDQDSVISGNVLVNDSDPDGDTLNVVAGTYATAQGGSVMIAANGGFTYTPLSGFYGFDNFNYTVQDGKGGSNAASVHLTINEGVNLISTIDFTDVVFNAYSTGQDMGGTISVRGDGSEVVLSGNTWKRMGFNYIVTENTVIEFEFRSTTQGELQGFVLDTDNNFSTGGKVIQLYGTENNSRFDRTYDYNGSGDWQSFTISVSDYVTGSVNYLAFVNDHDNGAKNGNSYYRNLKIYESDAVPNNTLPVAVNDTFTGDENSQIIGNVLSNDSDPDGDTLSAVAGTYATAQGGSVSILANGNFTYTPVSGFFGIDSFNYELNDGRGGLDTAVVYLTVNRLISEIIGTNGNDTLNGGTGDDILRGGDGNDTLNGGTGNDMLDGGAGIDTASYEGAVSSVTVSLAVTAAQNTGGAGIDTLIGIENLKGSSHADMLTGTSGANTIDGGGGNDIIDGGAGNDILIGGAGTDTLTYETAGSAVNVSLALTTAQNTGGGGTDTISTFENLNGSGYNDTLRGSSGVNTIRGGNGNDTLYGDAGNDILYGDAGNDTLFGDAGNDTLDGGAGVDTASYAGAAAAVKVSLAVTAAQNTGGAGNDTLIGIENLTGSAFNDTLTGDAGANTILGGAGNDIINGGAGDDMLDGGAGTDTLSYAGAAAGVSVNLSLSTAQNTIGAGIDTVLAFENLTGSSFNDVLTGTSGANIILGGAGNDIIDGGAGNDTLDGGAGADTASYASASAAVTVSLVLTAAQNTGGAGTDTLIGIENLSGSAFNDTLTGNAGANIISGGAGDDIIDGGAGNDTLDGGSGVDTASYASATAGVKVSLAVTAAQNTGGAGNDTLIGIENLTGSAFNDTLTGDAGANTILGGAGDDAINGGLGDDRLDGGAGVDTLSYAGVAAGVAVSLSLTTAQNTGGAGIDTISAFENLTGSSYNDTLTGNAGANRIDGGAGNDTINGGAGDDILIGGAGTDTLSYAGASAAITMNLSLTTAQNTGGAGIDTVSTFENIIGSNHNDILTGTSGANTIDGGSGNDIINGGAGNDILIGGAGTDTLTYETAGSSVNVSLALTTAQSTGGGGTDTISTFENLNGSGYNDTLRGSSGVNTIRGGNGNDTLYGDAGNDILYGDAGNDTLFGDAGNDTLYGGAGADTFKFTVGGGNDTIKDFRLAEGDKLDIKALLSGYDPLTKLITDYVQITTSGANSIVRVDANGLTGGTAWTQVAVIEGVTGLTDEAALRASGNLVV